MQGHIVCRVPCHSLGWLIEMTVFRSVFLYIYIYTYIYIHVYIYMYIKIIFNGTWSDMSKRTKSHGFRPRLLEQRSCGLPKCASHAPVKYGAQEVQTGEQMA